MKLWLSLATMMTALTFACSNAEFAGPSQRAASATPAPQATAVPKPTAQPTVAPSASTVVQPTPTPTPAPVATPSVPATQTTTTNLPPACNNTVTTTGIQDSSGLTFKLMTQQYGYDDGVAQCASAGPNGKLIGVGQNLPDAVLACKQALGTLWLRPADGSGVALWQPNVQGTDDPSTPHWIICYY